MAVHSNVVLDLSVGAVVSRSCEDSELVPQSLVVQLFQNGASCGLTEHQALECETRARSAVGIELEDLRRVTHVLAQRAWSRDALRSLVLCLVRLARLVCPRRIETLFVEAFNTELIDAIYRHNPGFLELPEGDARRAERIPLLVLAMAGSQEALEEILRRHRSTVLHLCGRDRDSAETVLDNVALQIVWRRLRSLPFFQALLRQAAHHEAGERATGPTAGWLSLEELSCANGRPIDSVKAMDVFGLLAAKPPRVLTAEPLAIEAAAIEAKRAAGSENSSRPRTARSTKGRRCRSLQSAYLSIAVHTELRREIVRLIFRWHPGRSARAAAVLAHLRGLPPAEVARKLRIPEGSAKTWGYKSGKFLRVHLDPSWVRQFASE